MAADSNTYRVAGRQVVENLQQEGRQGIDPHIFENGDLYGEYRFVERLHAFFAKTDAIPGAVGTAASMGGYTPFGASITKEGWMEQEN